MKTELDGPLPLEMRWINQRRDEGICIVSCELLVSNGDSHELSKCRSGTGDAAKKNFGGRISSGSLEVFQVTFRGHRRSQMSAAPATTALAGRLRICGSPPLYAAAAAAAATRANHVTL